jgi:amino acid transporter
VGGPRDLTDRSLFHRLSLIPVLAWIGLGADGLSSSCYGPEEAFRTLGGHTYLAVGLAAVMALTVIIIAVAYSRVIEHFPHGGGGYVVATKLLGERAGLVSGCALLVDYVLTITVSIAAAGDALFSFLPAEAVPWKLPFETACIAVLSVLNLRGVRESVLALAPIFLLFVLTHLVLIVGGTVVRAPEIPARISETGSGFSAGLSTLGLGGMALLFIHAYSLGGGTYTGIEAVSNGIQIMRAPQVKTGQRTMFYMAASLAFTASGLLLCYLLWDVHAVEGRTMNAVLAEKFVAAVPLGTTFVVLTLASEATLLVVAAQAGFVDGPRVLANMAVDSWVPHRFATLSERLTTMNGVLLMGAAGLGALLYTGGNVAQIVVMYSINVFITFSMTETSMCRMWFSERARHPDWMRKISIHVLGLAMCLTILAVTVHEKFLEGGWLTLLVTVALVAVCLFIRGHYRALHYQLARLYSALKEIPPDPTARKAEVDPSQRTAAVLVGGYGGAGIHATLSVFRHFPGQFRNVVFLSVGVIDSGVFKGEEEIEALRRQTERSLRRYAALAESQGIPATWRMALGIDVVEEATRLCASTAGEFPRAMFFAGKVLFEREGWLHRLLHNETAVAIQGRLHWMGHTMIILPVRVNAPGAGGYSSAASR